MCALASAARGPERSGSSRAPSATWSGGRGNSSAVEDCAPSRRSRDFDAAIATSTIRSAAARSTASATSKSRYTKTVPSATRGFESSAWFTIAPRA